MAEKIKIEIYMPIGSFVIFICCKMNSLHKQFIEKIIVYFCERKTPIIRLLEPEIHTA